MGLTRRALLSMLPASLLVPAGLARNAWGSPSGSARRFLFVFCPGGWDVSFCLAPMMGTVVDVEADAVAAEAHGLAYVSHASRPSVDRFFADHGDKTALVHGVESRSVAHDVCLRLMLTGRTQGGNDWPTQLAARSDIDRPMPMLHINGPTYHGSLSSEVVHLGRNGQLGSLVDNEAVEASDLLTQPFEPEDSASVDRWLEARIAEALANSGRGRERALLEELALSEERARSLEALADELGLSTLDPDASFADRSQLIISCFERDLTRVGMVAFEGWQGLPWDTHGGNHVQSQHFETLMSGLSEIMGGLAARPGPAGGTLADETTVVVLSEMGRYPKLNKREGKDHWTYTSAMLIGSGVRGGTTVGAYDPESFVGRRVDLASGEATDSGTALVPGHLGATLAALADIDPGELGAELPITALLGEDS